LGADPKQVAVWWGPHGFKTTTDKREFNAGGVWKHAMIGPDGTEYPNLTRFEEVVCAPRHRVHEWWRRHGGPGVHFRSTVTLVERDGKTEFTLRMVFDTAAERDQVVREYGAVEGGKQTLSRLASHLAGEFVLSGCHRGWPGCHAKPLRQGGR
jgi:uncharacterized protein YndB with AHSA1/START domain